MYPVLRMFKELALSRGKPALSFHDEHVSHHLCWPWDLDIWNELNNGRTLTLYDLGRIPMAKRSGLTAVLRRQTWGIAIAGAAVRYRRRVKLFDKITMRSKLLTWDARFLYVEQSMWKSDGECASHAVFRMAVTGPNGIVPTEDLLESMQITARAPDTPEWVETWLKAENERPWPPMSQN